MLLIDPYDGNGASTGNGVMVGLRAGTPERVRAAYEKAVALGGKDECPPGLRNDPPGFYVAYVRDLDGNKLAFYCTSIVPTLERTYLRIPLSAHVPRCAWRHRSTMAFTDPSISWLHRRGLTGSILGINVALSNIDSDSDSFFNKTKGKTLWKSSGLAAFRH